MFWPCLVGSNCAKNELRDTELPFLGLDGGCPAQLPRLPELPDFLETLF